MTITVPYGHPAWIEIDLIQFKKNILTLRQYIGKSKLCLPIKANAYGHGLIPIARAAVQAGVDYLAVSCLQEGAVLRQANIQIPIFVMGAIHEKQIPELIEYQLEFSISSRFKAELVAKTYRGSAKKCRVHIEIDTGMQRTGVRAENAKELLTYLANTECFEVVGVYSHLATADKPDNVFAKQQIAAFQTFIDEHVKKNYKDIICHIANSGGVCHYPESHIDMVRPGLLAFGCFAGHSNAALASIEPFFSLKAQIAYFKVVEPNLGVGYGHTYKTSQRTRIITIPVGYGDGYRRALSNIASILHRGKRYPIAGTICMDQFMVDISNDEAFISEEVTLIGKQQGNEIKLEEIAQLCDTIPYEILCGFNNRLPRYYRDQERQYWDLT